MDGMDTSVRSLVPCRARIHWLNWKSFGRRFDKGRHHPIIVPSYGHLVFTLLDCELVS